VYAPPALSTVVMFRVPAPGCAATCTVTMSEKSESTVRPLAAVTMLLLIVTYDITFDGAAPGSPHRAEAILYTSRIASGKVYTPNNVSEDMIKAAVRS
jgi:hypothetical protein